MAREQSQRTPVQNETPNMEQIQRRLNMLDERLDNIDSMVTAVIERVMSQVVFLHLTCPRCGKEIEVGIVGAKKPTA